MADNKGSKKHFAIGGQVKPGSPFSVASTEGYPKWGKNNTSTVPNDPANQINRAKGEPQKAAPGVTFHNNNTKTINDGTTDVVVSEMHRGEQAPEMGSLGVEKQHYPPCINPSCKSFGKSHPNCLCYGGAGGSSLEGGFFAHGGRVCSGPHHESCDYYAEGGDVELNKVHLNNPSMALDHIGVHHGLNHLLSKTGDNGRSENPHRHFEEHVDAARRGHKKIKSDFENLIGPKSLDIKSDPEKAKALSERLNHFQLNPQDLLNVGGQLGNVMPGHSVALGMKSAQAINYFQSIKPQSSQGGPFDPILKPGKESQYVYHRQLSIAENPMLILKYTKDATLMPQDLLTLHTVYPEVAKAITQKAADQIIDAAQKGTKIPYKQRIGLSNLLGSPLDATMTPESSQAIMQANAVAQQQEQPGKIKNATAAGLKQMNKVDDQLATPDQRRLMGKS